MECHSKFGKAPIFPPRCSPLNARDAIQLLRVVGPISEKMLSFHSGDVLGDNPGNVEMDVSGRMS